MKESRILKGEHFSNVCNKNLQEISKQKQYKQYQGTGVNCSKKRDFEDTLQNGGLHPLSVRCWSLGGSKQSSKTQYRPSGGARPACHAWVNSMPNKNHKTNARLPVRSCVNRGQGLSHSQCLCLPRLSCTGPRSSSQRVSQPLDSPSNQAASHSLRLAQQAEAVRGG